MATDAPEADLGCPGSSADENAAAFAGLEISTGDSVDAEIEQIDGVDYYRLCAEADRAYRIRVGAGSVPGLRLTVFDAEGRELASDGAGQTKRGASVEWRAGHPGYYWIKVVGSHRGSYWLSAVESGRVADRGDAPGDAVSIAVGEHVEAVIHDATDVDFFEFHGEAGESFIVEFRLPLPFARRLEVLNDEGEEIETVRFSKIDEVWWYHLLELPRSGSYRLAVALDEEAFYEWCWLSVISCAGEGDYSVRLRRSDFKDVHGSRMDEAMPLALGESVEGMIGCYFDVDYFKVVLEKGRIYRVRAEFPTRYSARLRTIDPFGNDTGVPPGRNIMGAVNPVFILPDHARQSCDPFPESPGASHGQGLLVQTWVDGEYTIAIENPGSTLFERYTLTVEAAGGDQVLDDHGGFTQYATGLVIGEATVGEIHSPEDFDAFRFDAVSGRSYYIHVTILDVPRGTMNHAFVRFMRPWVGGVTRLIEERSLPSEREPPYTVAIAEAWVAPSDGEYYLIVESLSGLTSTYSVIVESSD